MCKSDVMWRFLGGSGYSYVPFCKLVWHVTLLHLSDVTCIPETEKRKESFWVSVDQHAKEPRDCGDIKECITKFL